MPDDSHTESKSHHDVFISYAQQDKPVADAVCAKLESRQIRCWIAPRDVPPGKEFPEAIIDGIEGGRVVVVIFSSHANSSPHVIRELTNAVNKGRIIIPFRIEDVLPSKSMEYLISVPHWLDAVTPPLEHHINILIKTINTILGSDQKPAAGFVQATLEVDQKPVPVPTPPPPLQVQVQVPADPEVPAPEKIPATTPAEPVSPPFRPSKTILIASVVLVVLIVAVLGIYAGFFTPPAPIQNLSELNRSLGADHPGISDADYYRGSEARINTVVLTIMPTQTLAKDTELYINVDKDSSKAIVTVQFNGGAGMGLVRDNQVILTRSDGTVTEGKLNFNQRLSSVQLQGSRGTDRLQVVIVLHSGERKSVVDKLLPYRQY